MELQQGGSTAKTSDNGRYPDLLLQKGNQITELSQNSANTNAQSSAGEDGGESSRRDCCRNCKEKVICSCAVGSDTSSKEESKEDTIKVDGFDLSMSKGEMSENRLTNCARKWEYFPGKNKFYFDGRLMTAPSIRFCMLSFLLILVTFVLFTVFE